MNQSLTISMSSEKMISFLVEDFLDLAQIKAGRFRRDDKTFVIHGPFQEVIDIMKFKATHKSIEVDVDYHNTSRLDKIRCDERRLMQVLLNLVSNAVKFTPINGRISIEVKVLKAG